MRYWCVTCCELVRHLVHYSAVQVDLKRQTLTPVAQEVSQISLAKSNGLCMCTLWGGPAGIKGEPAEAGAAKAGHHAAACHGERRQCGFCSALLVRYQCVT